MSRDQQSIQDMWNAAQEILSFTEGMNYQSLEGDRRTQAAVLYEIVVIGETAQIGIQQRPVNCSTNALCSADCNPACNTSSTCLI